MGQESLFGGDGDTAAALIPPNPTLRKVAEAAKGCRACDLWKSGTQTVFGEGRAKAELMLVGEQPGDQEDLAGRPFVGPAGQLLDRALEEAGIDRELAYVTNVVKHFKWQPRGKRRIHQKPNAAEIAACRPWLGAELALIRPEVLVCLGATAAQALLGRQFRVSRDRGVPVESDLAPVVMATVHPSSILRSDDRDAEFALLVEDLRQVAGAVTANKRR
jgi:uracil-DNA glycosylase